MMASLSPSSAGEDDFPIVGTYSRDLQCNGNGTERPDLLVKITRRHIEANFGTCQILDRKRDGRAFFVHLQCKVPGDQLILGDVTFTIRDDERTLDFEDQDHTSDAVLHKCTE